jgi:hypothetical protein
MTTLTIKIACLIVLSTCTACAAIVADNAAPEVGTWSWKNTEGAVNATFSSKGACTVEFLDKQDGGYGFFCKYSKDGIHISTTDAWDGSGHKEIIESHFTYEPSTDTLIMLNDGGKESPVRLVRVKVLPKLESFYTTKP